jgi:hypothetical protein
VRAGYKAGTFPAHFWTLRLVRASESVHEHVITKRSVGLDQEYLRKADFLLTLANILQSMVNEDSMIIIWSQLYLLSSNQCYVFNKTLR